MIKEIVITQESLNEYQHWINIKNRYCKCDICRKFNKLPNGWELKNNHRNEKEKESK